MKKHNLLLIILLFVTACEVPEGTVNEGSLAASSDNTSNSSNNDPDPVADIDDVPELPPAVIQGPQVYVLTYSY